MSKTITSDYQNKAKGITYSKRSNIMPACIHIHLVHTSYDLDAYVELLIISLDS